MRFSAVGDFLRDPPFHIKQSILAKQLGSPVGCVTTYNVAIFPELKVLFNRIKKSGNTTVTLFLDDLARKEQQGRSSGQAKQARGLRHANVRDLLNISSFSSLAVVRDPYSRTLSAFLEKVGAGNNEKFSNYGGFGDPSSDGLDRFLAHISEVPWFGMDAHFWPQTELLFQPPEQFSTIIKLEELATGMNRFLADRNFDADKASTLVRPHQVEAAQKGKITNSSARLDLLSAQARRLIGKLYASDFAAFNYQQ